jgi:alpha-1,3-rhamnosyltransferase
MLVSVAVTTYNSEKYVLETLESVFDQAYFDLELIISDDCSQDDTLDIVINWTKLERVKLRFKSIQIIRVDVNTGVSANCNRILNASTSNYIKMIAGDDILFKNCIVDNVKFIHDNPEANFVFSRVEVYRDVFLKENYLKTSPSNFPSEFMGTNVSAKGQFQMLLKSDRISFTPSYFFKKDALLKVGGYDEENRLIEDYPMWLKLTHAGEKLYFFDKITVGYRAHSKSLSNSNISTLFQVSFKRNFKVKEQYVFKHISSFDVCAEYYSYYIQNIFDFFGLNKKNRVNSLLYKFFNFYVNPFYVLRKLLLLYSKN